MGADRSPFEVLLDLTVYAPLGLAVTARERLPDMIEKGRHFLGTQVNSARVAGGPDGGRATERPQPVSEAGPAGPTDGPTDATRSPAPSGAHLAIPGYDTLSASHVVQRLAGLSTAELEAVRAYEADTRGRRTILNRIAQLQTAS